MCYLLFKKLKMAVLTSRLGKVGLRILCIPRLASHLIGEFCCLEVDGTCVPRSLSPALLRLSGDLVGKITASILSSHTELLSTKGRFGI